MSFYAGIARTIITPPLGVDLCGYAGREPGCTGVHDDLQAKALVISDGNSKGAILSLDLVGLTDEQTAWIRQHTSAVTGILRGNILISCSHTHSGPAPISIRGCGNACREYVGYLLNRLIQLIKAADENLQPARFEFGKSEAKIAINRRHHTPDGVEIGVNSQGAVDYEVPIWSIVADNGSRLATIFNYACHAVVLDGSNRLVSADWPGAAQKIIEENAGGMAMFLQGCCGNINPRDRGTFETTEALGKEMAESVISALDNMEPVENPAIDIRSETIKIPLQPTPDIEEIRKVKADSDKFLENIDDSTPLSEIDINRAFRDWAHEILTSDGKSSPHSFFEIQLFSIGDAHIISLPGEVFAEYAISLKQFAPNLMVAGYANGNIGYVPTKQGFEEGGYEVDLAYRLYGEQMLAPCCEELILAAGERLLRAASS